MAEISEILESGEQESLSLEYKSTGDHPDSIVREIVALANNDGGRIIVGVREEDGEIVEIETAEDPSGLEESIQNQLAAKVEPRTEIDFQVHNYDQKQVVEITVESKDLLRSLDINSRPVFPIRQGSTTTYLHGLDLARAYAGEAPSSVPTSPKNEPDTGPTAFEYLDNSSAESREDQVLGIFNYVREFNRDDGISIEELSGLLRDARIRNPANLGVIVRELEKDEYIMRINSDPARWAITMAGIEYFESTESGEMKNSSLKEYYRMADSPTKSDSALIVGWYLEEVEDMDGFTRSEVSERAKEARIPLGANLSRDLSSQVSSDRLMELSKRNGKREYGLTPIGEDYVEDELVGL